EFGFGFPPRIFGIKKKGIMYSVNWIPIGGFVKIKGESGDNNDSDSFIAQPAWKRAIVLFAGVFMNFISACIILSIGFAIGLPSALEDLPNDAKIRDRKIQIIEVYPNSPAYNAGIKLGDYLVSFDDNKFINSNDAIDYVYKNQEKNIKVETSDSKENKLVEIKPESLEGITDKKVLGISMVDTGVVSYPWYKAPLYGFKAGFNLTVAIGDAFFNLLKGLFSGEGAKDVSGPIGVAVFTGRAVSMGFSYILQFMALLSINLAIINIFPFPALDGGRLLFLLIEKIRRKPNNQKVEAIFHNVGFGLLMLLMILVTYKDILKYVFHK
ncbi:MAG: RIP metalloprotease RseP, partial [Patescibacteria group bacterium]|nr:RIP metalloprotease RseP [Patescibacteria group bacterium]